MRLRDRRVQTTYPVRLTCQIAGCPNPIVKWHKDDKEISADCDHLIFSDGHFQTLEISKTNLNDSGIYSVVAENIYGAISCRCVLTVDKGIKAYIKPEFINHLEPSNCELHEGDELNITGRIQAYPSVGIMWYRDGLKLRPSRRSVTTLSHDGRIDLTINSITRRDAGTYTCVATNEVGHAESSAIVNVVVGQEDLVKALKDIAEEEKDIP